MKILACPHCKNELSDNLNCLVCNRKYHYRNAQPYLIKDNSPINKWYKRKKKERGFKSTLIKINNFLKPEVRVWSNQSINTLEIALAVKNQGNIVLIGSGFEKVYQKILKNHRIIRVGLPNKGTVDVFGDVCDLPLKDDCIDLIISSSVLEHVYNPERAISEMKRVLKKDGLIYVEIPFIRAYHMIPIDYQRYAYERIKQLFENTGFETIHRGICSGAINGMIMINLDFLRSLLSFNPYLMEGVYLIIHRILHPFKYLDRIFQYEGWQKNTALNFFYLGKKGRKVNNDGEK